jgi:hypothetical protein
MTLAHSCLALACQARIHIRAPHFPRGTWFVPTTPPQVIVTFDAFPLIVAYDTTGRAVWKAYLSNVRPTSWERTTLNGQEGLRSDRSQPEDRMMNVTELPPDAIAVQVVTLSSPDQNGKRRGGDADTYIISALTGAGIYAGHSIAPITAADEDGSWFVEVGPSSFPELVRMRYGSADAPDGRNERRQE